MSLQKTSRKFHKWLMLFIGAQFVIWSVTGAYMVFFDIHYIHGDTLVNNQQTKLPVNQALLSPQHLTSQYGDFEHLSLTMLLNKPVYHLTVGDKPILVDAETGQQLSPIPQAIAVQVAQAEYTGSGDVIAANLITDNPPFELSARRLPAWQVDFDDFGAPSIYVSAVSGQVVTKRHQWWRLFDWMFRFHVMDYQDSEVDNKLLLAVSILGLIATLLGAILTYFQVLINKNKKYKRALR